ncbi:alkaline shock response membrane anchor protein AmaP [Streptomyces thermoalcalitolerans]|uniref:Alkaline shock response membrane anchor protein AmaP n=1 Tax=Streptomyces thermoalcalitolerans TaxID=65605 RepID=A0ABP3YRG9_9ACTN
MLGIVNRVLTGLIGLVLLVAGGSVLAVGLGVRPPSWWIHQGRHDVLLTAAERTRWRGTGWWWPGVLAALAVLFLLALWWLIAVLRRRRPAEVLVDTGDDGQTVLRGPALADALAADAERLDGVARAHVRLTGRRTAPAAQVRLLLEPHADPGPTLNGLTAECLAHARHSANLRSLPAEVRLKSVRHRAERVS